MWKKEDAKPQGTTDNATAPAVTSKPSAAAPAITPPSSSALPVLTRAAACISQGIRIKGEVTGSEDLFVDGLVDGKLNLTNGSLTIGPNGTVKADVYAREVIVRGKIEGKVTGRDKVQLWSTGQVTGEVQTDRLAIEEGALLKGKVEAGKQPAKPIETKATAATAIGKVSDATPLSSGTAAD
ncbi:MAG: polymer-forming cytoskeletal protein [Candidatus Acidiferrum sp.]